MTMLFSPIAILFWAILGFFFFLRWKGHYSFRKFWHFGVYTSMFYSLILLFMAMLAVTFMSKEDRYFSFQQTQDDLEEDHDMLGLAALYNKQVRENPEQALDWQLKLLSVYASIEGTIDYMFAKEQIDSFKHELEVNIESSNPCEKAKANHLLGKWKYLDGNITEALDRRYAVRKCSSLGYTFMIATIFSSAGQEDSAFVWYLKSIDMGESIQNSFRKAHALASDNYEWQSALIDHPMAMRYYPFDLWTNLKAKQRDWLSYFSGIYYAFVGRYHPFFMFISFLIVAVVAYYFYRIDVFDRDSFVRLASMFFLACLFVPITFFITDKYDQGWDWYSGFVNDSTWGLMTFRVGLTEELIKIIVLLLAVYLFKWVNEPLDYIIYGSMGALAFAFLENIIYFHHTEGNVVFGRTIFSTIGHVFDTTTVAYGLALNRFKYKMKIPVPILLPVLLLMAAAWHGTYNTIVSSSSSAFMLIIPFFMIVMALLGGMINSSMNNSPYFDKHLIDNNDKGTNLIATSFILLFIVQQAITLYIHRNIKETAEGMYQTVFLLGLIVAALAHYLATFDLVKGKWISILEMVAKKRINRNVALATNVKLHAERIKEIDYVAEYLFGRITDRVMIGEEDAYFLVKLVTPFMYNGKEYRMVLIKHIDYRHIIQVGSAFAVQIVVPIHEQFQLDAANLKSSFDAVGNARIEIMEELQSVKIDASGMV